MSDFIIPNIKSRKWLIRIHLINHTEKGLYQYDIDSIISLLDKIIYRYICIQHCDNDIIHYHFILFEPNTISFKRLYEIFPYGDIQKQRGTNKEAYNYLLHVNQPTKKQYCYNDIITNFTQRELENWFLEDISKYELLLADVISYNSLEELLNAKPEYISILNKVERLFNLLH